MDQQQITICGCGWLGLELAKSLVKQNYTVYGTKQSTIDAQALATFGIQGIPLTLPIDFEPLDTEQQRTLQRAFAADLLVINVPPGRYPNSAEDFKQKYRVYRILQNKQVVKGVIYQHDRGLCRLSG